MKFVKLSKQFYSDYKQCPEICKKSYRPYCCMAINIDGLLFAIPLRHHITHTHCLHTIGEAGLDFSKAVVISKKEYIEDPDMIIEKNTFKLLKGKERIIREGMCRYIAEYKEASRFPENPYYQNLLKYSTLKYFEKYI